MTPPLCLAALFVTVALFVAIPAMAACLLAGRREREREGKT